MMSSHTNLFIVGVKVVERCGCWSIGLYSNLTELKKRGDVCEIQERRLLREREKISHIYMYMYMQIDSLKH